MVGAVIISIAIATKDIAMGFAVLGALIMLAALYDETNKK
jgi:hypothetical protein